MDDDKEFEINGAGCLFVLFKKLFKLIDRYVYTCPTPPGSSLIFDFCFGGAGRRRVGCGI